MLPFEAEGGNRYRIRRRGAMRVDALFYASGAILEDLAAEGGAALEQLAGVAALPGVVEPVVAMPDIHWGYGFPIGAVAAFDPEAGGVVSPGGVGFDINCGVRLLASALTAAELAPARERLADALYRSIPAGVGAERSELRLEARELRRRVLARGAAWAVEAGLGEAEDLAFIESGGALPGADPTQVSQRALERGRPQLGTLGSGNHFLEVGVVDRVEDAEAAAAFGLFEGQVTVLVHTGSRGLGHQVCQEFVERMLAAGARYGIELPDRQLAAAPARSPEGTAYLGAMAAAANFAFANRQVITAYARRAFERAGFPPSAHRLRLVYDLAHNTAKWEEHGGRPLLVHRKGATRAFPPGHPELPPAYREAGQPVLVPGDMGRYSFVLAGGERAMRESFGSACHGAGRRWSRHRARQAARARDPLRELEAQGVLVRAASRATVDEEIPEAYKDVAAVVEVIAAAGIARKVARLRPLIVVKG
ncbi:MAG: RtcB family protein [Bacillota bacterium]|nr:RtcB family protein [Bacillota bacterium]